MVFDRIINEALIIVEEGSYPDMAYLSTQLRRVLTGESTIVLNEYFDALQSLRPAEYSALVQHESAPIRFGQIGRALDDQSLGLLHERLDSLNSRQALVAAKEILRILNLLQVRNRCVSESPDFYPHAEIISLSEDSIRIRLLDIHACSTDAEKIENTRLVANYFYCYAMETMYAQGNVDDMVRYAAFAHITSMLSDNMSLDVGVTALTRVLESVETAIIEANLHMNSLEQTIRQEDIADFVSNPDTIRLYARLGRSLDIQSDVVMILN